MYFYIRTTFIITNNKRTLYKIIMFFLRKFNIYKRKTIIQKKIFLILIFVCFVPLMSVISHLFSIFSKQHALSNKTPFSKSFVSKYFLCKLQKNIVLPNIYFFLLQTENIYKDTTFVNKKCIKYIIN